MLNDHLNDHRGRYRRIPRQQLPDRGSTSSPTTPAPTPARDAGISAGRLRSGAVRLHTAGRTTLTVSLLVEVEVASRTQNCRIASAHQHVGVTFGDLATLLGRVVEAGGHFRPQAPCQVPGLKESPSSR